MFRIYNGESPKCDFHFPTNKESGWWEEALPLVLSITPTLHYTAGEGDGVFLSLGCQTGLLNLHPLFQILKKKMYVHLQVFIVVHNSDILHHNALSVTA